MREIDAKQITQAVAKLCIDANVYARPDITAAIRDGLQRETSERGKNVLQMLLDNAEIAADERIPICQDTGMAVVFVDFGQNVRVTGGFIGDAIEDGVRLGYEQGYLRKSVVRDPIDRVNTNDNTPVIIHYNITNSTHIRLCVAPKGFGSENMSALKMLNPSDGIQGVKDFVVQTVKAAGANPCPPVIVGVGVGGTFEKAALIAKQALLRNVDGRNANPFWAQVEDELLAEINELGIGAAGLGGATTALCVNINTFATHIAGLPVAVNIGCHVTRHAEMEL